MRNDDPITKEKENDGKKDQSQTKGFDNMKNEVPEITRAQKKDSNFCILIKQTIFNFKLFGHRIRDFIPAAFVFLHINYSSCLDCLSVPTFTVSLFSLYHSRFPYSCFRFCLGIACLPELP